MRNMSLRQLLLICSVLGSVQAFLGSSRQRPRCQNLPESLLAATRATEDGAAKGISQDTTTGPDMEAYASGYRTVFEELPFKRCTPSFGEVPADLVGSYFRSGPAMFSAGSIVPPKTSIVQPKKLPVRDGQDLDRMVQHPFDGDGAILGITFSGDGEVSARFRYIRTIPFTNERKKGARVYKAMDLTRSMGPLAGAGVGNDLPLPLFRHHLQPGLNKNRKNTSNTRAIYWGKRLMTLWEGGQPFKLDALALSTDGRSRLGGAIQRDAASFGAKMSYDSKADRALFYGIELGSRTSDLTLYEFDSGFRLVEGGRQTIELPGFAMINDFCSTENYAVFVQPNVVANNMQFLVSKDPCKTLSVESGSAVLHLIPRAGSQQQFKQQSLVIPAEGPSEANLQFCNAYEDGDKVIVDAILSDGSVLDTGLRPLTWPWGTSLNEYRSMATKKSLWRYTVDTKSGKVTKRLLFDDHCFFGVVNQQVSSQKHRYIYMSVGGLGSAVAPTQGIARFDCESGVAASWMPESHEFCGEPMYAPRKGKDGEDSGYVLSVLFNGKANESELVILEASSIAAGPITRIPLGIAVPHGLFGCFTSDEEATWSAEALDRRAKLADKIESRGNLWNEVKSDFSGLGLRLDDMEEYFGDWNPFA
jgi:all-trans-8'-apo-beta-carotenal 15,15'-oxygenase